MALLHGHAAPQESDAVIQRALRASLLGDAQAVHAEAMDLREEERSTKTERTIAENLEVLALSTERPLPMLREAKEELKGFKKDQGTRGLDRQLRRHEPRQRYREAQRDRRYDDVRRTFNAIAAPASSAVQGQFFPLIAFPFEVAERLVVGRPYVTPEQRREMQSAREAQEAYGKAVLGGDAASTVAAYTPRRRNLAMLQARYNAEAARDEGRLETAAYWYEREMLLQGWRVPRRAEHQAVLRDIGRRNERDRVALAVVPGASEGSEDYGRVLRAFLLQGEEPSFEEAARAYLQQAAGSPLADSVRAAQAANARATSTRAVVRARLADLSEGGGEGFWQKRSAQILETPPYDPARALREAQGKLNERRREYIFAAEDPGVIASSYTAEEARGRRGSLISRARGLFISDTLSRALFYPFLDPMPRPELLDAGAQVPSEWYATDEGEAWLRRVAHAQRVEKRFASAENSYRQLGDDAAADKMRQKAARHLERQGDRASDPAASVAFYRRALTAYSDYAKRERLEKSLQEAEVRSAALAIISRDELRAYPELWRGTGLMISPALLDGKKSNGEISKEGVAVLSYDAYSFIDRSSRERVEKDIDPASKEQTLRRYEPLRRAQVAGEEIARPLPRRKIPAAIEAGAVPGFSASPALVPLAEDERERRLYE